MNSVVIRNRGTAANRARGLPSSNSTAWAPARSGNTSRPPSPKVNASGGLPANTSSGPGLSTCAPNVSAMASTSRWKCMVALGTPLVPEVNAISATSSAAVAAARKPAARCRARRPRSPPSAPGPKSTVGTPVRARSQSWSNRSSHRASCTCARSATARSSAGRSSGTVVTTTAPALSTASQHTASQGVLGPRSSTRLPEASPASWTRNRATRSTRSRTCA